MTSSSKAASAEEWNNKSKMESSGSWAFGGDHASLVRCRVNVPGKTISQLLAWTMVFSIGWAKAKDRDAPMPGVLHTVRGRVIAIGGQPLRAPRVRLATNDGKDLGERVLGYEGAFAFEGLLPGPYLLTLEREDEATIGRAVEIKSYPAPKVIFLEITLNKESASVREIVTDASSREFSALKQAPSQVSRKALRAFEQAAKESASGSSAKAIILLKRAIHEQPDYYEAHNNLGVQYQKLQQWDQAIQSYRRAIELRPNSAQARVNVAAVFLEQGQIQSAVDSLEAARKAEPGSAYVHLVLGELYSRKQDYLKAQESLETSSRLSPQEARQAFGLLVQIAVRHEDAALARQYLDVMKQYFPSDPETLKLEATVQSIVKP
ncbi:MAG: tetratricopeptide repeat protein [Terriglobia bacterium]